MKKKVGLFGGSFDPIHLGHLNLAIELSEIHGLDEVLFCPAFCSPFKTDAPPIASPHHRLAMLRLALEMIPHFKIATLEIDRKGPSYTIDTIRVLQSQDTQLHLLLSEESAAHLGRWKDAAEVVKLAPPLIGAPTQGAYTGLNLTKIKVFEISSTEVRERLKLSRYCGHLVPERVLDYIQTYCLYT